MRRYKGHIVGDRILVSDLTNSRAAIDVLYALDIAGHYHTCTEGTDTPVSPPVTDEFSERLQNRSMDSFTSDINDDSTRYSLKCGMIEPTRDSERLTSDSFTGVRRSTRRESLLVLSKCTLVEVHTTDAKPTGFTYLYLRLMPMLSCVQMRLDVSRLTIAKRLVWLMRELLYSWRCLLRLKWFLVNGYTLKDW